MENDNDNIWLEKKITILQKKEVAWQYDGLLTLVGMGLAIVGALSMASGIPLAFLMVILGSMTLYVVMLDHINRRANQTDIMILRMHQKINILGNMVGIRRRKR